MEEIAQYPIQLTIETGMTQEQMAAEGDISQENFHVTGPHDPNRPCGLYETMVRKIAGFSEKGIIWYQGESDEHYAELYRQLFEQVICQWRMDWEDELPFIYAQLAPFESWLSCTGERYPELRRQQMEAWNTIPGVYMVSSSDCGNRLDIHPKEKAPVGHRMALSSRKHIYGEEIQGDSPVAKQLECVEKHLIITFENARKLHVTGDLINALEICADNNLCEVSAWEINENRLLLTVSCPDLSEVEALAVSFA